MTKFSEIAVEALGSLFEKRGFSHVAEERDLVEYKSSNCELNVGFERHRSSEVFFGIKNCQLANGPDFSFEEVIRAAGVPERLYPSGYAARDEISIRKLLKTMADLLDTYCDQILRGDDSAWNDLVAQRNNDAVLYAADNRLRLALGGASNAWQAKEYAKVVELLEPLRELLSGADRAKLEYAERKLR